jgi:hypothetical protein
MGTEYDAQLLEAVAARRRRLRDALLWGRLRARRTTSDNLSRILIGVVLSALLAAGCVGVSFIQHALLQQQAPVPTGPAGPP